jgi:threonine dehydrogenase-like Zn-dependent dehydrogenase
MQAVQVVAPGEARFIEIPRPEVKPGHVLVRTRRLSLCGSDIYMLRYAAPEHYPFPPGTTGHEMVGVVEAVDPPTPGLQTGDLVLALAPSHQAMAEYYLAPLEHVLALPTGKPIEHLLQAQQLGTVIYACKFLPSIVGKDAAVIGQGSAGLWFNFMLRRLGARRVFGIDLQGHRLSAGKLYGATDVIHNAENDAAEALHDLTDGAMVDLVVEAAGEVSAFNLAYQLVKEYGELLYFGVPRAGIIEFDWRGFFFKYCRAQSICDASREPGQTSTRQALEMIARGDLDVAPILTHRFPFRQVMEAYELQETRDEGAIKIVIEMPG